MALKNYSGNIFNDSQCKKDYPKGYVTMLLLKLWFIFSW